MSQRNNISIVPSITKTETTITTTSMKGAPSFEYRRSLRRGVARGNVYKLTICKFTASLNDSILVQSTRRDQLNGRIMLPLHRLSNRLRVAENAGGPTSLASVGHRDQALRLTRIVTRSRRYRSDSDLEPPAKLQPSAARTASARRPVWPPPQCFRTLSTNDMHQTAMM